MSGISSKFEKLAGDVAYASVEDETVDYIAEMRRLRGEFEIELAVHVGSGFSDSLNTRLFGIAWSVGGGKYAMVESQYRALADLVWFAVNEVDNGTD